MIQSNVTNILSNISKICNRVGKREEDVTLIAATKYADAPQIKELIESGITHIGENRIQDAVKKLRVLEGSGVKAVKHFIGHLQTNKVKTAVDLFDIIQSVDSLRLARAIDAYSSAKETVTRILVEVNTSGEERKFGVSVDDVQGFFDNISEMKHIEVLGLMTMAPFIDDDSAVRDCFRKSKQYFDGLASGFKGHERIHMRHLSMGMTDDYHIALEEGSNMLRIGRAFFSP